MEKDRTKLSIQAFLAQLLKTFCKELRNDRNELSENPYEMQVRNTKNCKVSKIDCKHWIMKLFKQDKLLKSEEKVHKFQRIFAHPKLITNLY